MVVHARSVVTQFRVVRQHLDEDKLEFRIPDLSLKHFKNLTARRMSSAHQNQVQGFASSSQNEKIPVKTTGSK